MNKRSLYPTYNVLSDLPENLQEQIKEGPIQVPPTFNTKYMLTYGTLRWGLGNWAWCFQGRTDHLATLEMKGFLKDDHISCQTTGDENHVCVMDLFIAHEETKDELNDETDGLESVWFTGGGYEATAVLLEHEGEQIIAKYYNAPWTNKMPNESHTDYAESVYANWLVNTPERMADMLERAPKAYEYFMKAQVVEQEVQEVEVKTKTVVIND